MSLSCEIKWDHRFQDQSHIMIDRQPAYKDLAFTNLHPCDHLANVRQQICLCEHYAFWIARTARCILQECAILRLDRWKIGLFHFHIASRNSDHAQTSTYSCFLYLMHFLYL